MRIEDLHNLLEELVAHPIETQWIEFKMGAGSITNEQIGEYISAMSNGATISNQPFGYMVWGVDDDTHEVKGTNFCFTTAKQGNQDLELWIRNLLNPKINFEIFEFDYHDKSVVLLRIPSAKGEPTNFKKKPFIRIGSNKTDLRNFPDNELLATTVDKYDTRTILEAMHNCIAHQNYSLNSRIIVTEKIDKLIFANAGSFFEGNPDDYSAGDKTPDKYRNPWLAQAMVNIGMIDTLGYGIHTMYLSQKNRYFPLPDYVLSEPQKVILQIYGHSIDENYSKLLIERKDLSLSNVVSLDRVQKKLDITKEAAVSLRKEGLIEGRNPNYFVSASIAEAMGQEVDYIKMRGIDDDYIQKVITDYLKKFKEGKRQNFESVLLEKLPDILSVEQKRTKIKNNLQALRKKGIIEINGKIWKMSKNG